MHTRMDECVLDITLGLISNFIEQAHTYPHITATRTTYTQGIKKNKCVRTWLFLSQSGCELLNDVPSSLHLSIAVPRVHTV